jgi:cytochrome c oxidase subunit 2
MIAQVPLFPEAASTVAGKVDTLYLFLLGVSAFFTALICVLIITFAVRYRKGSPAKRENPPVNRFMELVWAAVPLALTMVMFGWGAVLYFDMQTPPPGAIEIDVVGKQWMWRIQHRNGRTEINELHIPVNQPVRLKMISEDVIHSFFVPSFRVKQDVLPGYYTSLWFEPTRTGTYHLFCAEYCGTEHSLMRGSVIVMEQADYANWLSGETGDPPEVVGQRLFERYRCGSCHKTDGTGTGPSLVGIFGKTVPLKEGGQAVADEQYLRDSILNPAKQVVVGYQAQMPVYEFSEVQVLQLIAYLRSLSQKPSSPSADQQAPPN